MKRIEKFGAFVALSGAELTGLVHLSELSDDFIKDPAQHLQLGQSELPMLVEYTWSMMLWPR